MNTKTSKISSVILCLALSAFLPGVKSIFGQGNDLLLLEHSYYDSSARAIASTIELTYTKIPVNQLHTIEFLSEIVNATNSAETNVSLISTVEAADGTPIHQGLSNPVTLPGYSIDTLQTGEWTPSAQDYYKIQLQVDYDNYATDTTPTNNLSTKWMEISESIYARDYDYSSHGELGIGTAPAIMETFFTFIKMTC